jgi:hypothetical protein
MSRTPVAVEIELLLNESTDPRAPGGEITVALCRHWEHDGPCRWPHNSRIATAGSPARVRSIVIVSDDERAEVLERIEAALRRDDRWSVVQIATGPITEDEQPLADRMARTDER